MMLSTTEMTFPGAGGVAGERGRTVSRGPWWSIFVETQESRTVNGGAKNGSHEPGG